MKYIRTKDNIYEVVNDFIQTSSQELYLPHFKDHILKQADTIEELYDELVIVGEFGNFLVNPEELDKHADGQTKEMLENGLLQCYGAIWTDKGLIYVAYMNDKGELCLL